MPASIIERGGGFREESREERSLRKDRGARKITVIDLEINEKCLSMVREQYHFADFKYSM